MKIGPFNTQVQNYDTLKLYAHIFMVYIQNLKDTDGYYYQAEIKGETITWIVPHHFFFESQQKSEVDFKIMSIFPKLHYTPKFSSQLAVEDTEKNLVDEEAFTSERISALNYLILKITTDLVQDDVVIDNFVLDEDLNKVEEAKTEPEKIKKLKTLFKSAIFFE
ncbi:hypothetical protein ABEB36_014704 [Hypothenemus hampei]|uniref:Uncharacterized protein n=1 Tax=Hypothenemus hampei TaxID=57062 RepID=A0ABD1E2L7_HYPHA